MSEELGPVVAAQWLDRFRALHPRAALREHDPKFGPVYVRGQGSRVWDSQGRDYIDLTCGYSACNLGHAFEPLVEAARRQLSELTHVTGEPHVRRIELAEQIIAALQLPPAPRTKLMFNTSGSRAVETAWKAAYAYRPGKLLVLGPCFHGRSIATTALAPAASTPSVSSLDASLFDQHVIKWPQADYPYCARCPLRLTYPSCQLQCVQALFDHLEEFADEISAVLVEPAIGARGYIFPPDEFFQRLRRATQAAGILLIADEIQTGLGRCGEWLLSQQQGWQADLILLGKSLGGGLAPISVVIGRAEILESLAPGSESETFAASPLACAVGLEVLNQLRHGGWIERGSQIGQHLRQQLTSRLLDMRRTDTRVFDQSNTELSGYVVEGCGANCVCEFPDSGAARLYAESCFQRGLLVQLTGPELTRVVMLPALTMSDDELQEVFQRLPS